MAQRTRHSNEKQEPKDISKAPGCVDSSELWGLEDYFLSVKQSQNLGGRRKQSGEISFQGAKQPCLPLTLLPGSGGSSIRVNW